MKLVLEVDVPAGDAAAELGRIFRQWAGNLHHYQLVPGDGSPIYDSSNNQVGRWHVVGGRGADEAEEALADLEAYDDTGDDEDTADGDDTGDGEYTAGNGEYTAGDGDDTGGGQYAAGDDANELGYGASGEYARSDE